MTEHNKEIARRVIEEVFSQGRMEVADELIAPGAISHDPALPEPSRGPEGVRDAASGYRAGFPDLTIRIEDQCAEGDLVCTRWTAVGTNDGDFWGLSPTGRQATVTGITIDRITGDKIVESWTNWDALGLMQQLGVVPTAAPA
jgi:predicted ester cyclase